MIQKSLCRERCVRTLTRLMEGKPLNSSDFDVKAEEILWICAIFYSFIQRIYIAPAEDLLGARPTIAMRTMRGVTDESLTGICNIYSISLALCNFRLSNSNETSIISIGVKNDHMTLSVQKSF